MILKSIEIKNFKSIEHISFKFEKKNYLLLGDNKDDADGLESNGSGKTNFIDAIVWCLFNKSLVRKATGNDVLRKGSKKCSVNLIFEHRGNIIDITNNRPGKPIIKVNGDVKKKLEPFKYISSKLLGISYELFNKIIVLTEKNKFSLGSLTDKQLKDLLDNLISDEVNFSIQNAYDKNDKNYKEAKHDLITIPERILGLTKQIRSNIVRRREAKNDKVYLKKIKRLKRLIKINKEAEAELVIKNNNIVDKIENAEEEYKKELFIITEKIEAFKERIILCDKIISNNQVLIDHNNQNVKGAIRCPKCKHKFIKNVALSIKEINEKTEHLEEQNGKTREERFDWKRRIERQKNKLEEIKKQELVINELKEQLKQVERELTNLTNENKNHLNAINILRESKDSEYRTLLEDFEVLKDERSFQRKQLKKVTNNYDKLYSFFKVHLGKEGLKNYLYNKKLKMIEDYSNLFLKQVGVSYRIKLDGFRKLKSGKWKNNITSRIIEKDVDWSFYGRSSGEQIRIDYANIFAYRNLYFNKIGFTFGFAAFDELFNYLDKKGKDKISEAIKELHTFTDVRQTIVISHDDDIKNNFTDIIKVKKSKGVTAIE